MGFGNGKSAAAPASPAPLVDVGPETVRRLLHETTNASESQNRVVKHDYSHLRDGLVVDRLFEMQVQKDEEFVAPFNGSKVRSKLLTAKEKRKLEVVPKARRGRPKGQAKKKFRFDVPAGAPVSATQIKMALKADPSTQRTQVKVVNHFVIRYYHDLSV